MQEITYLFADMNCEDDRWVEFNLWYPQDGYRVSPNIVEWFEENNIPLLYIFLIPSQAERETGQISTGVTFVFDDAATATLFKLRWQ